MWRFHARPAINSEGAPLHWAVLLALLPPPNTTYLRCNRLELSQVGLTQPVPALQLYIYRGYTFLHSQRRHVTFLISPPIILSLRIWECAFTCCQQW